MTRFEAVLGFLIMAAAACLMMMLFIMVRTANAETIPRGLGHPDGAAHWYDTGCCDKRDCEPVETGAIEETANGYRVKYVSSRGFLVEGFLPHNSGGVRPSRDEMQHACATSQRLLCIYIHFGV